MEGTPLSHLLAHSASYWRHGALLVQSIEVNPPGLRAVKREIVGLGVHRKTPSWGLSFTPPSLKQWKRRTGGQGVEALELSGPSKYVTLTPSLGVHFGDPCPTQSPESTLQLPG